MAQRGKVSGFLRLPSTSADVARFGPVPGLHVFFSREPKADSAL